jgi:hypothetical protein
MYVFIEGTTDDDGVVVTATRVKASDELPEPPEGGGQPGAQGGPGGPGIVGQVASIDDETLVITTPQGDETSVVTTDDTEFVVNQESGSLSDVTTGMYVFIEGTTDDDGVVTATRVNAADELPEPPDGGGQPGGQGGPGGPGGPGGTGGQNQAQGQRSR